MSAKITYTRDGEVAVLTMDDGKVNAINFEWVADCTAAVDRAQAEGAGAIVFRGRDGIFSAGLDLKALPTYGERLVEFVAAYERIKTRLFTLPLPVVADVGGHALAGGAVLLLCCDYAVSDVTPKRIGLTETQVGIPMPDFVLVMAQARLNPAWWSRAILAGDVLAPEEACRAGFLSELVPDAAARSARAMARARELAKLPRGAYAGTKAKLRERVLAGITPAGGNEISEFFAAQAVRGAT